MPDNKPNEDGSGGDGNKPSGDNNQNSEKTFTKADLDAAVAAALKSAKLEGENGFLTKISDLTEQNKALTTQLDELKASKADADKLKTEFEALKASLQKDDKGKDKIDIPSLIKEISQKSQSETLTQLEQVRTELEAAKQELATRRIGELRQQLIQKHGGEKSMIVQLVTGDTAEAIEASIASAKEVYNSVVSQNGGNGGGNNQGSGNSNNSQTNNGANQSGQQGAPNNPLGNLPAGAGGGQEKHIPNRLQEVQNMTMEEYTKARNSGELDRLVRDLIHGTP